VIAIKQGGKKGQLKKELSELTLQKYAIDRKNEQGVNEL
jgi:hypothetical protein